jgi:hypothetical protein
LLSRVRYFRQEKHHSGRGRKISAPSTGLCIPDGKSQAVYLIVWWLAASCRRGVRGWLDPAEAGRYGLFCENQLFISGYMQPVPLPGMLDEQGAGMTEKLAAFDNTCSGNFIGRTWCGFVLDFMVLIKVVAAHGFSGCRLRLDCCFVGVSSVNISCKSGSAIKHPFNK